MENVVKLSKLHGLVGEEQLAEHLSVTTKTLRSWLKEATIPKESTVAAKLDQIFTSIVRPHLAPGKDFSFVDLFAGVGGMRKGFESIGGGCVFTSEWDRFAQKTYRANFNDDHPVVGDITKVDTELVPDHDVLLAGFPCQPFSLAGVSKKNSLGRAHGFECNTQGTLFFDVERIIEAKKPKAFLLENVKNLMSHDKGKTFQVITQTLKEKLGYRIHCNVVDANGFVPQHRQRIFIVGFREDVPFSWSEFEKPEKGFTTMKDILHPEDGSESAELPYTAGDAAQVTDDFSLSEKLWDYLQDYKAKHEAKGNGFGYGLVGRDDTCRTLSARYHKDGAEILIDRGPHKTPRRMTPRECGRLMGYPDTFDIPVSNTQGYRQFGNSVVVPVIKEVGRIMRPHIMTLVEKERVSNPELEDLWQIA